MMPWKWATELLAISHYTANPWITQGMLPRIIFTGTLAPSVLSIACFDLRSRIWDVGLNVRGNPSRILESSHKMHCLDKSSWVSRVFFQASSLNMSVYWPFALPCARNKWDERFISVVFFWGGAYQGIWAEQLIIVIGHLVGATVLRYI